MSEALGKGEDLFTLLGIFSGEVSWSDGAVMAAHFGYLSSSLYIPCSFSLLGTLHGPKKYAHTQTTPPLQTPSPNFPHPSPSPLISESPRTTHRSDLSIQLAPCTVTHTRPSVSSPTRITRRRSRLKHRERKTRNGSEVASARL
jgi:hypothetical protein